MTFRTADPGVRPPRGAGAPGEHPPGVRDGATISPLSETTAGETA